MRREFTQRENVLLLFLVIVLLISGYVKLFMEPLSAQLAGAQSRLATAQDSLLVEQTKLAQMQKMEKELENGGSSTASSQPEIPAYDNIDRVMIQLDAILSTASDYQMTFTDVQFGDKLVSRPIQMTFSAANYSVAKTILTNLYNGRYCCSLSDITVSEENGASGATAQGSVTSKSVSVKLTATFYEKYDSAAAAAKNAAKASADAAAGGNG